MLLHKSLKAYTLHTETIARDYNAAGFAILIFPDHN